MTGRRIVAIDGEAGSGKSTVARLVARRLGLAYVNTGLMYRAVAASALASGVDPDDGSSLAGLGASLRFSLSGSEPPSIEVEGWPADALATPEVESTVSAVSRHPGVRSILRGAQRTLGERGAVMEGRDIGSVVFPDAVVKVFLVAAPETRVRRRSGQRGADLDTTSAALRERDARDARTTPPVPAPGSSAIDTTHRSIEETVAVLMDIIERDAPELLA